MVQRLLINNEFREIIRFVFDYRVTNCCSYRCHCCKIMMLFCDEDNEEGACVSNLTESTFSEPVSRRLHMTVLRFYYRYICIAESISHPTVTFELAGRGVPNFFIKSGHVHYRPRSFWHLKPSDPVQVKWCRFDRNIR